MNRKGFSLSKKLRKSLNHPKASLVPYSGELNTAEEKMDLTLTAMSAPQTGTVSVVSTGQRVKITA